MTTGALIFAFNNEQTDYIAMAAWSAERIHRHLDVPVAVITDAPERAKAYQSIDCVIEAQPQAGGTRRFEDYGKTVTWYNAGRIDAYALSPWDQTLVLDADYVVASSALTKVLHSRQDFLCHRGAWDVTQQDNFEDLNCFGRNRMPMWWATVMMFRRSNTAQYIFDSMNMVRNNWGHYRELYHISGANYRNDYALSISLGIVSGHTLVVDNIPWSLPSVVPKHQLTQLDTDYFQVEYTDANKKLRTVAFAGMDFHAMGKKHLGDIVANSR